MYPSTFTRNETPLLKTGIRSAHCTKDDCAVTAFVVPVDTLQLAAGAPPVRDKRKSGGWLLVYATPASKNGDTSIGMNEFGISPNSGEPKSGIRNSVFATMIRLPNSRSRAGQFVAAPVVLELHP